MEWSFLPWKTLSSILGGGRRLDARYWPSDISEDLCRKDIFGKMVKNSSGNKNRQMLRFISVLPEISAYFQALCQYAARPEA